MHCLMFALIHLSTQARPSSTAWTRSTHVAYVRPSLSMLASSCSCCSMCFQCNSKQSLSSFHIILIITVINRKLSTRLVVLHVRNSLHHVVPASCIISHLIDDSTPSAFFFLFRNIVDKPLEKCLRQSPTA